jgi:hypothetical protein
MMKTHDIVNLIIEKFGGNRVKFDFISVVYLEFTLGHNRYRVPCPWPDNEILVERIEGKLEITDNYSKWVEGILNNMVRNESGEMVHR